MTAVDPMRPADSGPQPAPFTLLGDGVGVRCEDGVCAVPEPHDEARDS